MQRWHDKAFVARHSRNFYNNLEYWSSSAGYTTRKTAVSHHPAWFLQHPTALPTLRELVHRSRAKALQERRGDNSSPAQLSCVCKTHIGDEFTSGECPKPNTPGENAPALHAVTQIVSQLKWSYSTHVPQERNRKLQKR
jgi:hypothetical protein